MLQMITLSHGIDGQAINVDMCIALSALQIFVYAKALTKCSIMVFVY